MADDDIKLLQAEVYRLRAAALEGTAQRKALITKLHIAEGTIEELVSQRNELHRLLLKAQMKIVSLGGHIVKGIKDTVSLDSQDNHEWPSCQ